MWTKKPLARKRIFVQTPFSHSTLNLEQKKIHAAKLLAFSLHFLFRRDQNHYSNLTSKIMKMCEQILKKRQRPNTIQILWIVKNKEHRNIATLSLQLRSYNQQLYDHVRQISRGTQLTAAYRENWPDFIWIFPENRPVSFSELKPVYYTYHECEWIDIKFKRNQQY